MFKKLLGLLSDAAIYGASSALSQIISLALLPFYTQFLAPKDYGVLGMLSIITMIFVPLANAGTTSAIFRWFSLDRSFEKRSEILVTAICNLACTTLLVFAVCLLNARHLAGAVVGDVKTTPLVQLALLSAVISVFGAIPVAALRAQRRVKTLAVFNVCKVLLTVVLTVYFVMIRRMGVAGVLWGPMLADATVASAQFVVTRDFLRAWPSLAVWRKMLSYGLPFVPHTVQAVGMALFGQYVVREQLGLQEAGFYNVASKFAMPAMFIIGAVQSAWVPYKFEMHANDDDAVSFFRSAVSYYVAGITYLWVGLAAWGPELCRLMTTPEFHSAASIVPFVAFIPVAQGMFYMLATGIELSDSTRPFPLVGLAGLVTAVVSAFLLVPSLEAPGAAISTAMGYLAMTTVVYFLAQRRIAIPYDWPAVAALGLVSTAIVAITYYSQQLALPARIAIAILVSVGYPLVAIAVFLRSDAERHRMQVLWARVSRLYRVWFAKTN